MTNEQSTSVVTESLSTLTGGDLAVEARNLHRTYTMGKTEVPALRGFDLQVQPSEFVVIADVSRCGKSMPYLLGGLDQPTEGQVFIHGEDLSKLSDNELADLRLHKVGFVFQFFNLMPLLTAQANVELPLYFADVPADAWQARSDELLNLMGLTERANHRPAEMSGCEQQRVDLIVLGFSVLVSVIFALYHPRKASRLDPVQALRYEWIKGHACGTDVPIDENMRAKHS